MPTDELRDIDNRIDECMYQWMDDIIAAVKMSNIPKTGFVMINFIAKTNALKDGILSMSEEVNCYAFNVLYRSHIEHFLRFQYVFMKSIVEKNDVVGEEYLQFCDLNETVEYGDAWKKGSRHPQAAAARRCLRDLEKMDPDFAKISRKEIKSKVEQFQFKRVIEYVNSHLNAEKTYSGAPFLLNIIPRYSELSSFVHGGPYADIEMRKYADEQEEVQRLSDNGYVSFNLAAVAKQLTVLRLIPFDGKLKTCHNELTALIAQAANLRETGKS